MSLLSCLKVTQCSTSEIGDAPLYNSCSLPIRVMTTGPLPSPSKCKSGRFNAWGHCSTHRTTLRMATAMVFGVVSSEGHIMPPHIFEVGLKVNTKVYLGVLKSVVIPWCNQMASGSPWGRQQDLAPAHKSKETQAWLQKECYNFASFSYWPPPPRLEPAGLLRLVIRREHHQYDLPQHQSQLDRRHPPSICRVFRRRLWKRHFPSSRSISRRWLRLKAATLKRCQLYYINKLTELIFSIKVLQ